MSCVDKHILLKFLPAKYICEFITNNELLNSRHIIEKYTIHMYCKTTEYIFEYILREMETSTNNLEYFNFH